MVVAFTRVVQCLPIGLKEGETVSTVKILLGSYLNS
jgi:hypothetical protein